MNEPLSALNTFIQLELEDEVLRIRQDIKTTFLRVTHNPEEAIYLVDRIVIRSVRPVVIAGIVPVDLHRSRDMADPAFIRLREQVTRMVPGKQDNAR